MKRFVVKCVLWFVVCVTIAALAYSIIDGLGYSDHAYRRLTSHGEKSLIVGTSRPAQAIQPSIMEDCLQNLPYAHPVYNFSFNVGESPFGEVYYKAIKKKLGRNEDCNSLFIIAVDPFALSVEQEQDKKHFREEGRTLDQIKWYYRPQLKYLFLHCKPREWVRMKHECLHEDGWYEITPLSMDSDRVAENIQMKMTDYNSYRIVSSPYRLEWLERTITLFQENGTVFMCRVPVSSEMTTWENQQWPSFDEDMMALANKYGIRYFAFADQRNAYRTTDGNHLYKEDGAIFTKNLCDSIKSAF